MPDRNATSARFPDLVLAISFSRRFLPMRSLRKPQIVSGHVVGLLYTEDPEDRRGDIA